MNPRHLLVVLSLAAVVGWSAAVPAAASCAMPEPLPDAIRDAQTVFVGTVDSADDTGRIANVIVESVWKGEVDDHVQVKGGPGDPQMITSTDREFDVGTRYLFVPVSGNGQVFQDNNCTHTREWTKKVERLAPHGATAVSGPPPDVDPQADQPADEGAVAGAPVTDASDPEQSNLGWIAATAALALILLAGVAVTLRRRESSAPTS